MNTAFNTRPAQENNALTEAEEKAARRAASMKFGWMVHAGIFTIVNLALWLGGSTNGWLGLPTGGWIIGLVVHTLVVWMRPVGPNIREGMVEREREAIRRRRG